MDDVRLGVGVDHDCVTIGPYCFTAGQMEEVAQLLVAAMWQAGHQKARMDEDAATEARHEAIDRAEAFRDETHGWTGP
jgi:hypothetical protein